MIDEALKQAVSLLPQQRPIDVFIHHNTLHDFEDVDFTRAVEYVAKQLSAEPYATHAFYIKAYCNRRISSQALTAVIEQSIDDGILPSQIPLVNQSVERFLKKIVLTPSVNEREQTIQFMIENGRMRRSFLNSVSDYSREQLRQYAREDLGTTSNHYSVDELEFKGLTQLWSYIERLAVTPSDNIGPVKINSLWDDVVDRRLIYFLNAYTDQGIAYWSLPTTTEDLLDSFIEFITHGEKGIPECLCWVCPDDLIRLTDDLDHNILCLLEHLGVSPSHRKDFIVSQLIKLSGWSGSVAFFEKKPNVLSKGRGYCLKQYLLIRLLLLNKLKVSQEYLEYNEPESLSQNDRVASLKVELFYLFQHLGITPTQVNKWSKSVINELTDFLIRIPDLTRRRILHEAYEMSYKTQIMDAVRLNARRSHNIETIKSPIYQALFCIDDREESLRRHLEETEPGCETFGVAGFFGLNILYQGLHDHDAVSLCPVSMQPEYFVKEVPKQDNLGSSHLSGRLVKWWRSLFRHIYDQSRDLIGGAFFTALAGLLSAIPLFFLIHFPRLSALCVKKIKEHFFPQVETILLLHTDDYSGFVQSNLPQGIRLGFTVEEMAEKVQDVLELIGVKVFSEVIVVVGHGSSSLNNPHESAHDCGACGGQRGAANARAFAQMANDPLVRNLLRSRGIMIPVGTVFIGAYHDTCSDQIEYFDLDQVPDERWPTVKKIIADFDKARMMDAHERCRRFDDACHLNPILALKHAEGRSQNLREPRPEYGHCTNAICIIGRRHITKNLFLDRRAFLVSYDPNTDEDAHILAKLLSSVLPVCTGINLEYYFSYVDNEKFGCGTKLPHNIVGLMGVMNGACSDLRTGLPWQMVEIHEPVRLVTIVDATVHQLKKALALSPYIEQLVTHQWLHLGCVDPLTEQSWWVNKDRFIVHEPIFESLPEYSTSKSYYCGRKEHLSPVFIAQRS